MSIRKFHLKSSIWLIIGILVFATNGHEISKRAVTAFARMITCTTQRNAWDFKGYGCYCGSGGIGIPLDELDRCCESHDACYNTIREDSRCGVGNHRWLIYTLHYSTNGGCQNGIIQCKKEHEYSWYYYYLSSIPIHCRTKLCNCDQIAAQCFRNAPFDQNYENYNKTKC